MNNKTSLNLRAVLKSLFMLLLMLSLAAVPASVHAQEPEHPPQMVTIYAEDTCGSAVWPLTIQIWNVGSTGGTQYAEAIQLGQACVNDRLEDSVSAPGTFTGGPGGTITFTYCIGNDSTSCKTVSFQLVDGQQLYYEGAPTGYMVQNPEAFDSWRTVQITPEYIFNTYGIKVQDSFDEPPYETAEWTPQELVWLNDVLKELPPAMIKNMSLNRIVRNKVSIDENGNQKPFTNGMYYPCGSPPDKDCDGSTATIRIFDNALVPNANLIDAATKFKAIILHEMVHAIQRKKDDQQIYRNVYASPLVQNYMDATRNITDIYAPNFNAIDNGWIWGSFPNQTPKYILWQPQADNTPPTNYGKTNPLEDMCDSSMLYMYSPEKLKATSLKRYNFIRDFIFQGVEYENGIQKK